MDRDAFQKHLRQVFLIELDEHLQALERDLLALESAAAGSDQQPLIESLFRTAHTLKGAAHAVQHPLLEKVAHALESLFVRGRSETLSLDLPTMQLLFSALDAIRAAGEGERSGAAVLDDRDGPLGRIIPALDVLHTQDVESRDVDSRNAEPQDSPPLAAASAVRPATTAVADKLAPIEEARELPPTGKVGGQEKSVRLPAARVERMMTLGGELLLSRQRLAARQRALQQCLDEAVRSGSAQANGAQALAPQLRTLLAGLASDRRALDQVAEPLEADILHAGMAPFAEACEGLLRVVRDLSRESGREVQLLIRGGDIEMDRTIIESIRDPLLHLVRNALAHGIESPEKRQQCGKALRGLITVCAGLRGGGVEISVGDDGRGLDFAAIRARLDDGGAEISDDKLVQRIFTPGFSTEREVSLLAGRGVGLDVVSTTVKRLRGSVSVENQPGAGLRFALQLPLTLSLLPAVLVTSNGQNYAFDVEAVERLLRINPGDITSAQGHDSLIVDGEVVRVFQLSRVLQGDGPSLGEGVKVPALLLRSDTGRALFMVDELLEELSLPVKSLGPRFHPLQQLVGATLLGDGQVTLIVHAPTLIRHALELTGQGPQATLQDKPSLQRKRLLVAEDSLSTRTLMKGILEEENFTVLVAEDGLQAWQILQREAVDLLVSDIEMPNMDGFALTEAVRGSNRLQSLPIILVTALKTDQDRMRGMQAGADAYLVKSSFDQTELLAAIHQLL
ncbi:MAG: hypothetical protein VR73_01245 [Gammaproteobacteria bacterium BRH_c0]|nr:MAG: hypothetical protein VR73_01245 [Gammaproteobacteria bacterium BRH_c0]